MFDAVGTSFGRLYFPLVNEFEDRTFSNEWWTSQVHSGVVFHVCQRRRLLTLPNPQIKNVQGPDATGRPVPGVDGFPSTAGPPFPFSDGNGNPTFGDEWWMSLVRALLMLKLGVPKLTFANVSARAEAASARF